MDTVERVCCVRGYHIYRTIWTAADGEVLACERESHNPRDRYSVILIFIVIIIHCVKKFVSGIFEV